MANVKIPNLSGAVGQNPRPKKGKPVKNAPADVKLIQDLLNGSGIKSPATGKMDKKTVEAIKKFQTNKLKFKYPDGVVDVGQKSYKALVKHGGAKMGAQNKGKDNKDKNSKDEQNEEKDAPAKSYTVIVKRGENGCSRTS